MQNFLAKSVALATLVGGFGLTGDLAWIAERGTRVLGAADVPEQCELPATAPGGIVVHESPRSPQTIGQPQAPQVAAPAAAEVPADSAAVSTPLAASAFSTSARPACAVGAGGGSGSR